MKTFTFDGQYVNRVIDYLSHSYSAVTRKVSKTEQGVMAIFVHEEYVWRTGSYQTLTAIVESQGDLLGNAPLPGGYQENQKDGSSCREKTMI